MSVEIEEIAKKYNVPSDSVFLISQAQVFEADQGNLLVKMSVVNFDAIRSIKTESFFATIKGWFYSKIFKDTVKQIDPDKIKLYVCAEIPSTMLKEEIVFTALTKEAVVVLSKNGTPGKAGFKIIDKETGKEL